MCQKLADCDYPLPKRPCCQILSQIKWIFLVEMSCHTSRKNKTPAKNQTKPKKQKPKKPGLINPFQVNRSPKEVKREELLAL